MKKLLFFILFIFFAFSIFSQPILSDSLISEQNIIQIKGKESKTDFRNFEKLAWEMMLPPGFIKPEKTPEMKAFEQMLLKMKSGVALLTLMIEDFKLPSKVEGPAEKNKIH